MVIPIPTGSPPHVKQSKKLEKLPRYSSKTLKVVKNLLPKIESSVKVAIEESSVRSGMVTPDLIKDMFSEFSRTINDCLETMQTSLAQNTTGTLNESSTTIPFYNAPSGLYSYGGRFYDVPGRGCTPIFPRKPSLRAKKIAVGIRSISKRTRKHKRPISNF